MHHPHHDGCANAPQNAELQADVAAQIEGLVAVIPPGGVKQRLEGPAAHQLNEGGQQHSPRKQNQQVVLQRQQQGEHRRHAAAVNGAERPVQKAPVHQFAGVQRGVGHLGAPAQKCIDKKQPEQLINWKKMQLHGRNPSFRNWTKSNDFHYSMADGFFQCKFRAKQPRKFPAHML